MLTQKLENLIEACQEFDPHLVIIDSASNASVSIVEGWNGQDGVCIVHVAQNGATQGKTAAVKQALEHINQSNSTDLVLMTDADALFEADTVSKLMHWFSDSTIGCVGLHQNALANVRKKLNTEPCSQWFEPWNRNLIAHRSLKVHACGDGKHLMWNR